MPRVLINMNIYKTHMWESMPCREDTIIVNHEATTKKKKMYFVIKYIRGPWKGRMYHCWTWA